jgi:hypothetical protein
MATAYITEYSNLAIVDYGRLQVPQDPPIAEQTVAIGSEAKSNAFNAATRFIRIHVDAICSIKIGTAPTATTSSGRLAANQTEFRGVNPGDKISVISNS